MLALNSIFFNREKTSRKRNVWLKRMPCVSPFRLLYLFRLMSTFLVCYFAVMRVGKLPESQLNETAAPRLRIIARNGTGVDMIHKDTCLRRGIVVTNQPGGNAQAVAEVSQAPVIVSNCADLR